LTGEQPYAMPVPMRNICLLLMPVRNRQFDFEPLGDGDAGGRNPFAPPAMPVEVCCMYCGEVYESWQMIWIDDDDLPGGGVWCCPTAGCEGIGFCFDVWPTDPDFQPDFDPHWREQAGELNPLDTFVDDEFVESSEDALTPPPADVPPIAPNIGDPILDDVDDPAHDPEANDEASDPRSAYLTNSLVYELLQNTDDWYEFFHQRDPRPLNPQDPLAERNKLDLPPTPPS
jgi:hypothetical protein